MNQNNKPNEIYLTRIYDAPVKAVWAAFTETKRQAEWWGPRGFTITTHIKELKPGGFWSYTMHGPDGTNYSNKTKYLKVNDYKCLSYDHGGNDNRPPLFRVTVLFTELNGKTQVDMTMACPTPEAAEETKKIIKKANGNSTWDRLAEYLAQDSAGKEIFVINRSFNCSVEKMFQLWTDPQHLTQWMPPTGLTMNLLKCEIRQEGSLFYVMTDGKNMKMYGRAKYLEVKNPNRLVYTQQFCDENEKVGRHPLSTTWPETMLTTIDFIEEEGGKTRITLSWEPFENQNQVEIRTFAEARAGMTLGWTGSFDKLEEYLSRG